MPILREEQKIFGETGSNSQFGKIGSDAAGSPETTKDLAEIQSLPQYSGGLFAITDSANEPPRIEDLNSLYYLITKQLKYLFQAGTPEWNSVENYFVDQSFVIEGGATYKALTDNQNKQPSSNPSDWKIMLGSDGAYLKSEVVPKIGGEFTGSIKANGFVETLRNSSGTETNVTLKRKVVEIGVWNMDATSRVEIEIGLSDVAVIRGVDVIITDDFTGSSRSMNKLCSSGSFLDGTPQGSVRQVRDSKVTLDRVTGGSFDSANYDRTDINRGWIIIDYAV